MVPKKYRHTLIAIRLIESVRDFAPAVCASGIAQQALPLYRMLGWEEQRMHRNLMLIKSGSVVSRYLKSGLHSWILAGWLDVLLAIQRVMLQTALRHRARSLTCEEIDVVPDAWNNLLHSLPGNHMHRSVSWLQWMKTHAFLPQGERCGQNLYGIFDANRKVLGYFLTKRRFFKMATQRQLRDLFLGSLEDWHFFDPQRLSQKTLFLFAIRKLCSQKVHAIEICQGDRKLSRWLKRWGLPLVGEHNVFFQLSEEIKNKTGSVKWESRPGDGDHILS